ncbi:hypothetical protein [Marinagarivorans algicola]|uniref:hypothetical protein n=1 Tax=Marinagarivorans algicola TaxID=1513270 RepID=UPI003734F4A8
MWMIFKGSVTSFFAGWMVSMMVGCASSPIAGKWQYSEGNTVIGLDIQGKETCELSLLRFVSSDLKRKCRYERNALHVKQDAQSPIEHYLIYLHDEQGRCDAFADFEFTHDTHANLITFLVGEAPFYMQKQP